MWFPAHPLRVPLVNFEIQVRYPWKIQSNHFRFSAVSIPYSPFLYGLSIIKVVMKYLVN